ncbi:hypothetical protein RRF57_012288 [Xylaria bambusicola]|uniref:Uncharacterized protein n=1 Tax=Xylaria bambusicola TaxID=326684 RepID=A0AAN7ZDJ5_9PEZI
MGFTLKLTNRSRQGLKKLPSTLDVADDATIESTKKQIARLTGISDFNRIGIFDPVSKKTIKDRNALIRDQEPVIKNGEMIVKDLGTFFTPHKPSNAMTHEN